MFECTVCLSIYVPTYLPIYLPTHTPIHLPTYGSTALVDLGRFFSLIYIQSVGLLGGGV
jgi:hypothetical protein